MELPEGWFWDGDIASYRELYSQVPRGGVTCEVGSWQGRSLCAVADIIKARKLTVHVVDTWGNATTGYGGPEMLPVFTENMRRFRINRNIITHLGYSIHKANEVPDKMALVFLDADHHYDAVKADLVAYAPKAKVIAGHDWSFNGICQATKETIGTVQLLPDQIWFKRIGGD